MANRRSNTATHVWKKVPRVQPYSACIGGSSDLIAGVAERYLSPGDLIADVTFGQGSFWRNVDLTPYNFYPSDLRSCPDAPYDFRHLPYRDRCMDVVVLDPPRTSRRRVSQGTTGNDVSELGLVAPEREASFRLCLSGMREASRVLKHGGLLWVKCRDTSGSDKQYMEHIAIHDFAVNTLGFAVQDFFIQVSVAEPSYVTWHRPARKSHRYLWILRKAK